jgi:excisionase family DNA binding protein
MTAPHREKPTTENWLPKLEAAKFLGVSIRELERKSGAGRIRTRKVRLAGEKSDRVVYHPVDLATVKRERETNVVMRQEPGTRALAVPAGLAIEAQMAPVRAQSEIAAALVQTLHQLTPPRITKFWLTVQEAADYSGLPPAQIEELVRDRHVLALGRGPKTWRVQRSSLDDFGRATTLPRSTRT